MTAAFEGEDADAWTDVQRIYDAAQAEEVREIAEQQVQEIYGRLISAALEFDDPIQHCHVMAGAYEYIYDLPDDIRASVIIALLWTEAVTAAKALAQEAERDIKALCGPPPGYVGKRRMKGGSDG